MTLASVRHWTHSSVHSLSNLDIRACAVSKTSVFEKLYYQLKWVRADVVGLLSVIVGSLFVNVGQSTRKDIKEKDIKERPENAW
jgi:hypothetical protein